MEGAVGHGVETPIRREGEACKGSVRLPCRPLARVHEITHGQRSGACAAQHGPGR